MKTISKHTLLIIGSLFFSLTLLGQDINFSQFYDSPLTLNPATTGTFVGDYRISGIYRRQQGAVTLSQANYEPEGYAPLYKEDKAQKASFETFNIGVDMPIYIGDHKIGVGLIFNNDVASVQKLTTTKVMGSLSYIFKTKGNTISVGLQTSYTQMSTDLVGGSSWAGGALGTKDGERYLIPDDGSETIGGGKSLKFFDFNVGALWTKKMGKLTPTIGISYFHITTPNYSLMKDSASGGIQSGANLPSRLAISAKAKYNLNSKIILMPNFIFMSMKRIHALEYGINIGYKLKGISIKELDVNYVYLGPQIRHSLINTGAVILTAGINMEQWNIGISRDFTASRLRKSTPGMGAWEVSVIYTVPETLLKKTTIPCERY